MTKWLRTAETDSPKAKNRVVKNKDVAKVSAEVMPGKKGGEDIVLPHTLSESIDSPDMYTGELPVDREQCLDLVAQNFLDLSRFTAIRFWFIGRIIHDMEARGEENVMEDILERTHYEKRAFFYMKAFYSKFPDFSFVNKLCQKGLSWTELRQLAGVKSDKARELIAQQVLSGDLEKQDLKEEIHKVNEEYKQESKAAESLEDDSGLDDEGNPIDDKKKKVLLPDVMFTKFADKVCSQMNRYKEDSLEIQPFFDMVESADRLAESEFTRAVDSLENVAKACSMMAVWAEHYAKLCREFVKKVSVEV